MSKKKHARHARSGLVEKEPNSSKKELELPAGKIIMEDEGPSKKEISLYLGFPNIFEFDMDYVI